MERVGIVSYRAVRAIVGRLPARAAWTVIGWFGQLTYRLWPSKRQWANENFGHVLGLPPDHPDVQRLALRAYRNYARYLVELMRLPRMPLEDIAARVEPAGLASLIRLWRETGGLILVAAHVGNNEFVAGGVASHGLPIIVLADDTTFPEMFDLLKREREKWGVRIVPWLRAARRPGVSDRSASTSGTSAARRSVFTSRSSPRMACAFAGSTVPAATSTNLASCCPSIRGCSFVSYRRLA